MKKLTSRPSPASHFSTDIPAEYDKTIIRVIPGTPSLYYIYWELSASARETPGEMELHVFVNTDDGTPSETPVATMPIQRSKRSIYLQMQPEEEAYTIEIGIRTADNDFMPFCSTTFMPQQGNRADKEKPQVVEPLSESLPDITVVHESIIVESGEFPIQSLSGDHKRPEPTPVGKPAPLPSSWVHR